MKQKKHTPPTSPDELIALAESNGWNVELFDDWQHARNASCGGRFRNVTRVGFREGFQMGHLALLIVKPELEKAFAPA